jgi:hypothetical protein
MQTDVLVLALLAIGDFALMGYLRRRHGRRTRSHRMAESLKYAMRRETGALVSF